MESGFRLFFSVELDGLMDELAPNAIQGQQKLNTAPVNQPKNQPQQQQPAYNPTDDLLVGEGEGEKEKGKRNRGRRRRRIR